MIKLRIRFLTMGLATLVVALGLAVVSLRNGDTAPERIFMKVDRTKLPQNAGFARKTNENSISRSPVENAEESRSDGEPAAQTKSDRHATVASNKNEESPRPWIETDPAVPGNSLSYQGSLAGVVAFKPFPENRGVSLSVVVGEIPKKPAEADVTETEEPVRNQASGFGLTYEEQLFRTKWGWTAFNQLRKSLQDDAGDLP